MLKKGFVVLLAAILFLSPLAIRWLYFYEGRYQPGAVTRPDLTQIEAPLPQTQSFADRQAAETLGTILVDLAHGNHVQMSELNVLQARLTARGHRLEPVTEAADLAKGLRDARALVIISPGQDWTEDEIQQVERFVDKGGRLLLVTDPTRYGVLYDELGEYAGIDYDAPHINDLATRFGLTFQADYLYNTVENEGNFRDIRLTDLADQPLTEGVDQLVFFAAHSIVSDAPPLISVGGETRSSTSERVEDLTVGLLAADGAVLALGDLTFMTEPNNAVYDNDQFVANVASFLSSGQRQYELADFPFFFDDEADLVFAGDAMLDSGLLTGGSTLQALFVEEGKSLTLRETEDKSRDTLFFGLYEQAEQVEPYLAEAQVTLLITPTETLEKEPAVVPPPAGTPSPKVSQPVTFTLPISPSQEITTTPVAETKPSVEVEPPSSGSDRVVIEPLGDMVVTGTLLLLYQTDANRVIMVVLSDTEKGLNNGLERLTKGDLANCLLQDTETTVSNLLALCPTGETADKEDGGGWKEPGRPLPTPTPTSPVTPTVESPAPTFPVTPTVESPAPTGEPKGSILVIALDQGKGRYDSLTGADEFATILEEGFEVKVWSIARDGPLELKDLTSYDLTIWTAGDFEDPLAEGYNDLLFDLMVAGRPALLSGAYVSDTTAEAIQRDIQIKDATHPVAKGFKPDEVINFVSPPSGQEYAVGVLKEFEEGQGSIIFVRGPESEESGIPSIVTLEGQLEQFRVLYIGFPIYLLPETARSQLVLNAVAWLLKP